MNTLLKIMLEDCKPEVKTEVVKRINRMDELAGKAGGKIASRQIFALVIMNVENEILQYIK